MVHLAIAQGVTPDGISVHNRLEGTTERALHSKIVDNVLSYPMLYSRFAGRGKKFTGKTKDFTIKITDSALGEFFSGLETLASTASDTTIELSYAHTAFQQPIVLSMLESFANVGPEATIDLDLFKIEEAEAEAKEQMGSAIYGTGSGDEPLGLEAIVDDGTNNSTIGGQSRTTYSALDATVTASGGTLTLAKLATLFDNVSNAGAMTEQPSLNVTTETVWSLYEQLLQPQVVANYSIVGNDVLPVRGNQVQKPQEMKGTAGFRALTYRGIPVVADSFSTSQVWYMLNERYIQWYGRTQVPSRYQGQVEKISVGKPTTMEGAAAAPSDNHGWFRQELQMLPNQAAMIGRIYVFGQLVTTQPRTSGKLTGITGV